MSPGCLWIIESFTIFMLPLFVKFFLIIWKTINEFRQKNEQPDLTVNPSLLLLFIHYFAIVLNG
jgi:hypothetical protein